MIDCVLRTKVNSQSTASTNRKADIVDHWIAIYLNHKNKKVRPVMVFDGFYCCHEAIISLRMRQIPSVISFNRGSANLVTGGTYSTRKLTSGKVYENEKTREMIISDTYSSDKRKYYFCWTNGFEKKNESYRKKSYSYKDIANVYKQNYSKVDNFNQHLCYYETCLLNFKSGKYNLEHQTITRFLFSIICKNLYTIHQSLTSENIRCETHQDYLKKLGYSLFFNYFLKIMPKNQSSELQSEINR